MQPIRTARLLQIAGFALTIAFIVAPGPLAAQQADSGTRLETSRLVDLLDSANWDERNTATLELASRQDPAAIEKIRASLESGSPESRERARLLLDRILPLECHLNVWVWRSDQAAQLEAYYAVDVAGARSPVTTEPTVGAGEPISVALLTQGAPYYFELSFGLGGEDGLTPPPFRLLPGEFRIAREEERFSVESFDGLYRTQRERYLWLVELRAAGRGSAERVGQPDRGEQTEELVARFDSRLESARSEAWFPQIAGPLTRFGLIASESEEAFDPTGVSLSEVDFDRLLDEVEAGSAPALNYLLERLSELDAWRVVYALRSLARVIKTLPADDPLRSEIFTQVVHPEAIDYYPWRSDGQVEEPIQAILDETPPATVIEALPELLSPRSGSGGRKSGTILAHVRKIPKFEETLVADPSRLEALGEAMSEYYSAEPALVLFRDLKLGGWLTPSNWQQFLESLNTAAENAPFDLLLERFIHCPELTGEDRRDLWIARAERLHRIPFYRRRQLEPKLERSFGELEERMPQSEEIELWTARTELWVERIESKPLEQFELGEGEEAGLLTRAELRVVDGQPEVVTFDSQRVQTGRTYVSTSPGGRDQSLFLEDNERSLRFDQYSLRPDVPAIRNLGQRRCYRFGRSDLTPQFDRQDTSVRYLSIVLLESDREDSYAGWPEFLERLTQGLATTNRGQARAYKRIFEDIQPREAIPYLQKLEAERGGLEFKRLLVLFGVEEAKQELLDNLSDLKPTDALDALSALVSAGDPAGIAKSLELLADPPASVKGRTYSVLRALSDYQREFPNRVNLEQWLGPLVKSLDTVNTRSITTQLLRSLTGQDFGFTAASRNFRGDERRLEYERVCDRWRDWYKSQYPSLPK